MARPHDGHPPRVEHLARADVHRLGRPCQRNALFLGVEQCRIGTSQQLDRLVAVRRIDADAGACLDVDRYAFADQLAAYRLNEPPRKAAGAGLVAALDDYEELAGGHARYVIVRAGEAGQPSRHFA